jgi:choline transport protein
LFWGSIAGACGMSLVYASIAEMASMSEALLILSLRYSLIFSQESHSRRTVPLGIRVWATKDAETTELHSRYISYNPGALLSIYSFLNLGWLCAIGWQVYLAGVAFMVAGIIQGLIILNVPSYEPQPFHATLLTIAIISFAIFFNTVMATRLPFVEGAALILHLAGFFAIIIPLWVMAPRSPPRVIFEFSNVGGWNSNGLAAMIGLTIPMGSMIGYDCSVHMCKASRHSLTSMNTNAILNTAEEIHDASLTLPRALMWAIIPNAVLAFLMAVTLIFTVGDINAVLVTPTLEPFIQVFYNATNSYAGTNIMSAVMVVLLASCCISEVATASRQIWSFARDKGVPGSTWLAKVGILSILQLFALTCQITPGWNIPIHAVSVSFVVTSLIACINLGSNTALNAINSLGSIAILSSYFVTISCLIWRRLKGPVLPPRRWTLGKYGLAINIAAVLFLIPFWFFAFWPLFNPVTPQNMNWASVMFAGTIGFALIYYAVRGKNHYTGPVALVKRN